MRFRRERHGKEREILIPNPKNGKIRERIEEIFLELDLL